MSKPSQKLYQIQCQPGVRRDGTILDGDTYNDAQWCRFQRGRPKKMGGFVRIADITSGPVRECLVWSRQDMNAIYTFSQHGIEMALVDSNGVGGSITDRSPAGWTQNANAHWSVASQYDAAVGSQATVILAHASSSLVNIDDTMATKPYLGTASGTGVFTQIADAPAVSGGVFSTAPYTWVYGSDGYVGWSDANQPQIWAGSAGNIGDAGSTRATGAKIVKGLPLRSGSGPAALLWSLDSVVRADWAGGGAVFKFSHLSTQSSVLSSRSVIEYDGNYFWLGVDRFLVTNGSQVQELPNQMNINWFFDNLNYAQRQKVWAMKVPRYGEIHWYFPYGDATECTHCVIYNVREQTWYDNRSSRSAGYYSQVLHYPVMTDAVVSTEHTVIVLTGGAGSIAVGDVLVGDTSGVKGTVIFISGTSYTLQLDNGPKTFTLGETVTDVTSGATRTAGVQKDQYASYVHEKGTDATIGEATTAIESYFETADFGLPTGGPTPGQFEGINNWTRLTRVEPDFLQEGEMTLQIISEEAANAPEELSSGYNFTSETERIDMRIQARGFRLRFTSNEVGGHYEMGRVILHTELGDNRT